MEDIRPRVEIAPGLFAEVDAETLAEINAQREENPLSGYFPYKHQLRYHAAKTPIKALIAGNQSGKTHSSLADDLIQLLDEETVPDHLRPFKRWHGPITVWIGSPKVAKVFDTLLPKLRELTPKSQLKGGSLDKAFSSQHKTIDFANGSQVVFKTYDHDVDAYSGASIHRMHWDEEPEGEHGLALRHEARIRLLKHNGDECLSMTPLFGLSWVYDHVYERRHEPHITVVQADMDDNLSLSEESKKETLAMYTEEERKARKSGEFVHFKGLVYDEFKDDKHVVPRPSIEHVRGLDPYVGIDPGVRTTGITFSGFDRDNSMLVFDELYLHNEEAIPENAARFIREKLRVWQVPIADVRFIIDPSSRNRSLTNADDVQAAFMREGINPSPGQNAVEAGVFEVKRRLQHEPSLLHIAKNCEVTIWEIGRYRMDDRVDGKFEVVKQDDHILDPIRYVAMERAWVPPNAPPVRHRNTSYVPDFQPPYQLERKPLPSPPTGAYT